MPAAAVGKAVPLLTRIIFSVLPVIGALVSTLTGIGTEYRSLYTVSPTGTMNEETYLVGTHFNVLAESIDINKKDLYDIKVRQNERKCLIWHTKPNK